MIKGDLSCRIWHAMAILGWWRQSRVGEAACSLTSHCFLDSRAARPSPWWSPPTSPLSIGMETVREAFYYRLCRLPGLLRVEEKHVDHFIDPQHLSLVSRLLERWKGHKDSKRLVVVHGELLVLTLNSLGFTSLEQRRPSLYPSCCC